HRADRFLQRLWEWVQATPEYAGRTSLIVSADHGRGSGEKDWTDHGEEVPAADRIWLAVMGPETPALGIRAGLPATQAQFAATLAALVGEDFVGSSPRVAPAVAGTVRGER
ncbi:MAG TPA: AP protein, partial [Candidatus Dormibacteraeota bacterium]|nr:AP protein [Candidatus Dormibacteraeota bacterium]